MDLVRHEISLCCLETRSASWRRQKKVQELSLFHDQDELHRNRQPEVRSASCIYRPASCAAKPGCTVRQVPLAAKTRHFPKFFGGPVGSQAHHMTKFRADRWECVHAFGGPIAEFSCVGRGFHQSTTRNDRRTSSLFRSVKPDQGREVHNLIRRGRRMGGSAWVLPRCAPWL